MKIYWQSRWNRQTIKMEIYKHVRIMELIKRYKSIHIITKYILYTNIENEIFFISIKMYILFLLVIRLKLGSGKLNWLDHVGTDLLAD